ncbi:carotenoid isomerooxygenase-like [Oratosquilla oratoria]|uniref:carotenoid isomerooxygenase-like n=1 Tax=Oratosquilla oratoria TaxID=337810 RepID=UPI003F7639EE
MATIAETPLSGQDTKPGSVVLQCNTTEVGFKIPKLSVESDFSDADSGVITRSRHAFSSSSTSSNFSSGISNSNSSSSSDDEVQQETQRRDSKVNNTNCLPCEELLQSQYTPEVFSSSEDEVQQETQRRDSKVKNTKCLPGEELLLEPQYTPEVFSSSEDEVQQETQRRDSKVKSTICLPSEGLLQPQYTPEVFSSSDDEVQQETQRRDSKVKNINCLPSEGLLQPQYTPEVFSSSDDEVQQETQRRDSKVKNINCLPSEELFQPQYTPEVSSSSDDEVHQETQRRDSEVKSTGCLADEETPEALKSLTTDLRSGRTDEDFGTSTTANLPVTITSINTCTTNTDVQNGNASHKKHIAPVNRKNRLNNNSKKHNEKKSKRGCLEFLYKNKTGKTDSFSGYGPNSCDELERDFYTPPTSPLKNKSSEVQDKVQTRSSTTLKPQQPLSVLSAKTSEDNDDDVPAGCIREEDGRINYYPNCDAKIWVRSCTTEVVKPLHGKKHGQIPAWLRGTLVRNGPGRIQVGEQQYNHIFDGSALLHRFHIKDGDVTYQNKFLRSRSYEKDTAAQRIVVNYFGTRAQPDPCVTIMQNLVSTFSLEEHFTDNAQISLYPYGDGLYALTETPFMYRIDPETLDTKEKVDMTKHVSVFTHTAHPHVDAEGNTYNIGQGVSLTGPKYYICKFPKSEGGSTPFDRAEVVGSVSARWPLSPCYMHSFGMTENFWVIIEQPLVVSVVKMLKVYMSGDALINALRWSETETKIHLVRRDTGKVTKTQYLTTTFFFLHVVNAFEQDGHVIVDIASYKNADMLHCMYTEALKNASYDPCYAKMFRGRPKRWVIPVSPDRHAKMNVNLVSLAGSTATARWRSSSTVFLEPELLADIGCEVPRLHYDLCNGRPYRYFYAICSDVDHPCPGTLIKVDVESRTHMEWGEDNVYPSEPIFVPRPGAETEDDGVVLSALLRARGLDNQVCLIVLDGTTFTELGRVEFECPGPVPKCLHGWFVEENQMDNFCRRNRQEKLGD